MSENPSTNQSPGGPSAASASPSDWANFEPEDRVFWNFYDQGGPSEGIAEGEISLNFSDETPMPSPEGDATAQIQAVRTQWPPYERSEAVDWIRQARGAVSASDMEVFQALLSLPLAQHFQEGGRAQKAGFEFAMFVVENDDTPGEKMLEALLDWNPSLPSLTRVSRRSKAFADADWTDTEPLTQAVWGAFNARALRPFLRRGGGLAKNDLGLNLAHETMSRGDEEAVEAILACGGSLLDKDMDGLTGLEHAVREATDTVVLRRACEEAGDFSAPERERWAVAAFAGAVEQWNADLAQWILGHGGRRWVEQKARSLADWGPSLAQKMMLTRLAVDWEGDDEALRQARGRAQATWRLLLAENLLPGVEPETLWLKAARAHATDLSHRAAATAALAAQSAGFAPKSDSALFTPQLCERLEAIRAASSGGIFESDWGALAAQARSVVEARELSQALSENHPSSAMSQSGRSAGVGEAFENIGEAAESGARRKSARL